MPPTSIWKSAIRAAGLKIAHALSDLDAESGAGSASDTWAGTGRVSFIRTGDATTAMPTLTTLASFAGADGSHPFGTLIADAAGDLFGTTQFGGAYKDGAVFEIVKTQSGYARTPVLIASFNGADGKGPVGGLIVDAAGDLFGTTEFEGGGYGTAFEIVKTQSGYASAPTTLVKFSAAAGENPYGGLVADAAGNLFGTTYTGGAGGIGTVFEIVKTQTGYANAATPLVSFDGADGRSPVGNLIIDATGDLFGVTTNGGAQ